MVEFFVFLGHQVKLEHPIDQILEKAVAAVYREHPFRYSTVQDPLFHRIPSKDNLPAILHLFPSYGKRLEIRFLVKGGGSENLSRFFALDPTTDSEEIERLIVDFIKEKGALSCPPLHIGIGIGGSSEKAMTHAKYALTFPMKKKHLLVKYAEMEETLLHKINLLKIGFQGLGEGPTAFCLHIETSPTHIATLPVAIAVDCYLNRKGVVIFEDTNP